MNKLIQCKECKFYSVNVVNGRCDECKDKEKGEKKVDLPFGKGNVVERLVFVPFVSMGILIILGLLVEVT